MLTRCLKPKYPTRSGNPSKFWPDLGKKPNWNLNRDPVQLALVLMGVFLIN